MSMRFAKLHGAGNDFILIDGFSQEVRDPVALALRLCARRFGVGADGLILVEPCEGADARMRIWNSDGSEPEMCGNGIRCAASFLRSHGLCTKNDMRIQTLAGIKQVELAENGRSARVDMGCPVFDPQSIPVESNSNCVQLEIDGESIPFFCVSMGNPHAVTFELYPRQEDFLRIGAQLEHHALFTEGANIEFCRVGSRRSVCVKVWERGAGATLACGTGSCAVLAAGVALGLIDRSAEIQLPGGTLTDTYLPNGHIQMTGPVETVFEGEIK